MSDKGKLIRDIEMARSVLGRRIAELEDEQTLARVRTKLAEIKGLKPPVTKETIRGFSSTRERLVAESGEMYTWLLRLETEFQAENFPATAIPKAQAGVVDPEPAAAQEPTVEELKEEYEQPIPAKRERRRGKKQ